MNGIFSLHSAKHRSSSGDYGEQIFETTEFKNQREIRQYIQQWFNDEFSWSEHHRGCSRIKNITGSEKRKWLTDKIASHKSQIKESNKLIKLYTMVLAKERNEWIKIPEHPR